MNENGARGAGITRSSPSAFRVIPASPTGAGTMNACSGSASRRRLPFSKKRYRPFIRRSSMTDMKQRLSVAIITMNEEPNIRRTLESVAWADEIVVVDSGSTDRTVPICREYTDKVIHQD